LGCCVDQRTARALGVFDCASANEPGFALRAAVYAVAAEGPSRRKRKSIKSSGSIRARCPICRSRR
jgi:hypothetical protein